MISSKILLNALNKVNVRQISASAVLLVLCMGKTFNIFQILGETSVSMTVLVISESYLEHTGQNHFTFKMLS